MIFDKESRGGIALSGIDGSIAVETAIGHIKNLQVCRDPKHILYMVSQPVGGLRNNISVSVLAHGEPLRFSQVPRR